MSGAPTGRGQGCAGDYGSAVVLALLASVLLAALGHGLVLLASTERAIAANHLAATEAQYAAEAAVARVVPELRRVAEWTEVLSGRSRSAFAVGSRTPVLPSGQMLDLDALTAAMQAAAASDPWGANNPVWRLYAYGPLDALSGTIRGRAYVGVWIADDPAETDGDPAADGNRVIRLRAEAFGPARSRRSVDVTVGVRAGSGTDGQRPRVLAWQEVR